MATKKKTKYSESRVVPQYLGQSPDEIASQQYMGVGAGSSDPSQVLLDQPQGGPGQGLIQGLLHAYVTSLVGGGITDALKGTSANAGTPQSVKPTQPTQPVAAPVPVQGTGEKPKAKPTGPGFGATLGAALLGRISPAVGAAYYENKAANTPGTTQYDALQSRLAYEAAQGRSLDEGVATSAQNRAQDQVALYRAASLNTNSSVDPRFVESLTPGQQAAFWAENVGGALNDFGNASAVSALLGLTNNNPDQVLKGSSAFNRQDAAMNELGGVNSGINAQANQTNAGANAAQVSQMPLDRASRELISRNDNASRERVAQLGYKGTVYSSDTQKAIAQLGLEESRNIKSAAAPSKQETPSQLYTAAVNRLKDVQQVFTTALKEDTLSDEEKDKYRAVMAAMQSDIMKFTDAYNVPNTPPGSTNSSPSPTSAEGPMPGFLETVWNTPSSSILGVPGVGGFSPADGVNAYLNFLRGTTDAVTSPFSDAYKLAQESALKNRNKRKKVSDTKKPSK